MPPSDVVEQRQQNSPVGPTIGIFIIIALLTVAAIYFAFQQLEQNRNIEPPAYIPGDQT